MTDGNYLRDSLKAIGAQDVRTCTLCGAFIPMSWAESHNSFHQADYERLDPESQDVSAETCKLCGILVNRMYEAMHSRVHQADYEPFGPGSEADSCKLCGILINRAYQPVHLQNHG
jgi:hypothetical protein